MEQVKALQAAAAAAAAAADSHDFSLTLQFLLHSEITLQQGRLHAAASALQLAFKRRSALVSSPDITTTNPLPPPSPLSPLPNQVHGLVEPSCSPAATGFTPQTSSNIKPAQNPNQPSSQPLTSLQHAAASCAVQLAIASAHCSAALLRRCFHSWTRLLFAAEAGAAARAFVNVCCVL
jgi:hypothetical protein